MQRLVRVGLCVGVVLAAAGARLGAAEVFSVTYDQRMETAEQVISSTVKVKGERFRSETTMDGMQTILLRTPSGIYQYLPAQGMAMKLPMLTGGPGPVRGAENYQDYLRELNARQVGSETVNGIRCDVYEFTDPAGSATTVCVWPEKAFPLRMHMDTTDGRVVMEFSNIRFGAVIPDSAFELPPGVQVMEVGGMMDQMMQGMGE